MPHYGTWRPYVGSDSILLAVVLLIVTGVLISLAIRLHHPIAVKRPGKFLGVALVMIWLLSVTTFLVAITLHFPINCAPFRTPSFLRELPP